MRGLKAFEYVYGGPYRTHQRAEDSMEDSFCEGDIDHSQRPRVATLRDHRGKVTGYALVLTDTGLEANG